MSFSFYPIFLSLVIVILTHAEARPVYMWDYQKKFEMADLVIVGRPIQVSDTKERINLPGVMQVGLPNQTSTGVPVIGVNTRVAVYAVRKGEPALKEIVLHHYRLAAYKVAQSVNAAALVTFNPEKEEYFLFFLKREPDGRYAPLDKTDPGINSIEPVSKGQK